MEEHGGEGKGGPADKEPMPTLAGHLSGGTALPPPTRIPPQPVQGAPGPEWVSTKPSARAPPQAVLGLPCCTQSSGLAGLSQA